MTGWEWFAGGYGDVEYDGVYPAGGCATKDDAIAELARQGIEPVDGRQLFYVIEARSSTAKRHYVDPEVIPFVRTRNHELLDLGEVVDARTDALRARLAA